MVRAKSVRRLSGFVRIMLAAGCLWNFSCTGNREPTPTPGPQPQPQEKLELTGFSFPAEHNPRLNGIDAVGTINGGEITVLVRNISDASSLIPEFTGKFARVEIGDKIQLSTITPQNFNQAVVYTLTDSRGNTRRYRVSVTVFTGLPIVRIDTGGVSVSDKETKVPGSLSISNTGETATPYSGTMTIRGRGNATWRDYPKKPYRIKLDSKSGLLGMPSDRDWVLLAEYCDKSMLRNSYLFGMSELAGLAWTPQSHHVELYLNNEYLGTYLLAEHVKTSLDRMNVADDGFMIERDNYYYETLWFQTATTGTCFAFKHPDPDDKEIAQGDENYNFTASFMNDFETALYSDYYTDPDRGYRKYIDVANFAKWYLVQEILGNIDTNPYYILRNRGSKLEMFPVWDSEWCLGLAAWEGGWVSRPATSPVEKYYWRYNTYFDRLMTDPYFIAHVKSQWTLLKSKLPEFESAMSGIADRLQYAREENFSRWKILGQYVAVGLVAFPTWQQEVDYAAEFLKERVEWFDTENDLM